MFSETWEIEEFNIHHLSVCAGGEQVSWCRGEWSLDTSWKRAHFCQGDFFWLFVCISKVIFCYPWLTLVKLSHSFTTFVKALLWTMSHSLTQSHKTLFILIAWYDNLDPIEMGMRWDWSKLRAIGERTWWWDCARRRCNESKPWLDRFPYTLAPWYEAPKGNKNTACDCAPWLFSLATSLNELHRRPQVPPVLHMQSSLRANTELSLWLCEDSSSPY